MVEYADGTPATMHQMAYDVANFMAWASDPTMQERKQMGLKVMLFHVLLCDPAILHKQTCLGKSEKR